MSDRMPLIDFHAHILPGADHGSRDTEESLSQLALIRNAGVDTVVATPHFYPNRHKPEDHLRKLAFAAEELANRSPASPRICIGAEVLYCDGLERMEGLEELCIRGTNILLLELPGGAWNESVLDTVSELLRSYTVVLAHIDRYVKEYSCEIESMLDMGALAQINTDSLASFIDRRRIAPFLKDERVVALGSDLHLADRKCYARFSAARKRLGEPLDEIMRRSARLLETAETI